MAEHYAELEHQLQVRISRAKLRDTLKLMTDDQIQRVQIEFLNEINLSLARVVDLLQHLNDAVNSLRRLS